ncbi:MAG: hypothetical protein M1832_005909 [Thelocarpon impressellum]|nr:MAG: hypothetical protein M1832_005909 [Thelocarpon impressellum]
MGSNYAPASMTQSPDTTSPLYPGRPIRPLPKRRIRSRLSPNVADTILSPPAPATASPLFYFPHSDTDARSGLASSRRSQVELDAACEHDHSPTGHDELDSEDEEVAARASRLFQGQRLHAALGRGNAHRQQRANLTKPLSKPPPPHSTASSVDGYDSFENTNNKKKRKIPTPGSSGNHHSHLSADMANMGLSSPHDNAPASPDELGSGVGQYYGSGNSAAAATAAASGALAGPGRARLGRASGRSGSMRSPLGVSSDGSNAWASGRAGRQRPREWAATAGLKGSGLYAQGVVDADAHGKPADQGIISAAIASAAERGPRTPPKGQENVSLLQQQAARKTTPTKTQFTFTSSADVTWPGGSSALDGHLTAGSAAVRSGAAGHLARDMATQGTQTSPNMALNDRSGQGPQHASNASRQQQQPLQGSVGQQAPQQPKKSRARRSGKEYALAARQRRLQQEYSNYHHPPAREDIWICEFCEYESIFGSPPEALMRQYEIKDQRERRRLAEKRRLLEKAKLKGRKGKKSKAAKNAAAAASAQQQQQQPADATQMQSQGTQSDELADDGYDEDAVLTAVPQSPVKALNVAGRAASTGQAEARKTAVNGTGKGGGGGGRAA